MHGATVRPAHMSLLTVRLVIVIASDVDHDAPRQLSDSVEPRFDVFLTFKEPFQLLIAGELTWRDSMRM